MMGVPSNGRAVTQVYESIRSQSAYISVDQADHDGPPFALARYRMDPTGHGLV